ncbi:MAG: helix-turn-helix domain-containing protein [Caldimonas sp.]
MEIIDRRMVAHLKKVARGETLFRAGDRFDSVFAAWTGFFKTVIGSNPGREQVTGFQMCGDLLGLGGIDTGRLKVDAIALENSQVCVVPLKARGFSSSSVLSRMSREEIGSYLGLKLETVSRTFSKFQESGLLFVQQRQIQITDPVGLQNLLADAAV